MDSLVFDESHAVLVSLKAEDAKYAAFIRKEGKEHDAGPPEPFRYRAFFAAIGGRLPHLQSAEPEKTAAEPLKSAMAKVAQYGELVADYEQFQLLEECSVISAKKMYGEGAKWRVSIAFKGCPVRKEILEVLRLDGVKIQAGRAPPSALERAVQTQLQKAQGGKGKGRGRGRG